MAEILHKAGSSGERGTREAARVYARAMSEKPAAGWYPATAYNMQRYWDGEAWTGQTRKKPGKRRGGHYVSPEQRAEKPPKPPTFSEVMAERKAEQEARQAQLVCPHCQVRGNVTSRRATRVRRQTASRIGLGIMTLGATLPVTGVSKKRVTNEMHCSNCGMRWDVD